MKQDRASKIPRLSEPMAASTGTMAFNQTGSWRYMKPVISEKLAPCRGRCPAETDIPRVLGLVAERDFEGAFRKITECNPLPAVTGRVCYHPCQGFCSRAELDTGISVQSVERFVGEFCIDSKFPNRNRTPAEWHHSVGIIGSGPAGLSCAYFLRLKGHSTVVYEAESDAGGMLRMGIPSYRLPREFLDIEISRIREFGVEFELGCTIGKDLSIVDLRKRHEALFVATGAHRSKSLKWLDHPKVQTGLGFLEEVNRGDPVKVGRCVIIIGGGNTAIDAARTALRLGGEPVIVYRRTRDQMPAHDDEIRAAEDEGIDFLFLASPTRVREGGAQLEVEFQEMRLDGIGEDGRARPVPVGESYFTLEADNLIVAVGEMADLSFLRDSSDPAIFIGGDAETGPSMVIQAIASGKLAAERIDFYLGGLRSEDSFQGSPFEPFPRESLNLSYFEPAEGILTRSLPAAERSSGFAEVHLTIGPSEAVREANRCLSCGVCNECGNCWLFCPEAAVAKTERGFEVDLTYCKGCGICVEECPRGVASLIEEDA
ncbi:MAG: FAD-dependent oxidoreductase [Acidobacteriota bacterium]|nr:MAG: FAD-dependent oxidoreductase [Acidobacteriota bacterium]